MKKQLPDRSRWAIWLCAAMLLWCLWALGRYLAPVLKPAETKGDAFGMMLIDIADEATADSYHVQGCGVYVLAVREKSPAAMAGISSGDLLLSVNDSSIASTSEFVTLQEAFTQGEKVALSFRRGTSGAAYGVQLVWNEE